MAFLSLIRGRIKSLLLLAIFFSILTPIAPTQANATPTGCSATYCIFDNGVLRFGNSGTSNSYSVTEGSINTTTGLFRQPFYRSADTNWYQLTFSNYPLDMALGSGTGGSNWTGNTVVDLSNPSSQPTITSIDYSGFVATSTGGSGSSTWAKGYGTIVVNETMTVNGQLVEITQRYELGRTDSFVKITTNVRNLSIAPISNLNIWVGTRDDYVGSSDRPQKTRGNLTGPGGTFQQLTNATDKASALRITTAAEGALFYTTTLNADMSFSGCCSFSNAYNTRPDLSANGTEVAGIRSTFSDGSYAAVLRAGDVNPNSSATIVWFYAAGAIGSLDAVAAAVSSAAAPNLPNPNRGNGQVVLTWTAPLTSDPITNYEVRYRVVGADSWITAPRTDSPSVVTVETITGLSNDLTYEFQVRAVTTRLSDSTTTLGDWSGSSTPEILGSPESPTSLSAVGGDGSAIITFTPAVTNGTETATITNYEYFIGSPETWTALTPPDTTSPITITGLQNGKRYDIQLRAVNQYGPGPSATIQNVVTLPVFADSTLSTVLDTNIAYTDSVTATASVTYEILPSPSSLPPGLSFNTSTGQFSGRPTALGSYTFTIKATNAAGSVERTFTLGSEPASPPVAPAQPAIPQPRFLTLPVFTGTQGEPYSFALSAENTDRYEIVGSLPEGLVLNPTTGVISGTPTQAGVFTFVLIIRGPQVGLGSSFDFTVAPAPRREPTLDPIPESVGGNPRVLVNSAQIVGVVRPNEGRDGIVVDVSSWKMTLSVLGPDGRPVSLQADEKLQMTEGQDVLVAGDGFKPLSPVRAYLFSIPTLIGQTTADAQGNFRASFPLPAGIMEGDHSIQVNGISPDNDLRSATLPAVYRLQVKQPEVVVETPAVITTDTSSVVGGQPTGEETSASGSPQDSSDSSDSANQGKTGEDASTRDSGRLTIVVPFEQGRYDISEKQSRILAQLRRLPVKSVRLVGHENAQKSQLALKVSLNRAIEVQKAVKKILPRVASKVRGSGREINELCRPYNNKCVVVYVQS